ncbi:hypothetical protein FACS1894201_10100 [Bacteroidia bacterium]|nr:hypothetical protein FACS1894201_10100 [Bacteroidia bacterium]
MTQGGLLTILRMCLSELSNSDISKHYRIIALVANKKLACYPNIMYLEFPKSKRRWVYRLFYEYIFFNRLSKRLKPVLWLSLHDMTPRVNTPVRATYMHNATPFFEWTKQDWRYAKSYVLFALFYKYLYRINIHRNTYLIVQQNWLRDRFAKLFHFDKKKIIVARPASKSVDNADKHCVSNDQRVPMFFYPSLPHPFKNFETVCEACEILKHKNDLKFQMCFTFDGSENRYAQWIVNAYQDNPNIRFLGLLDTETLKKRYQQSTCLIFASTLETWGLPISEYIGYEKPMILSDLMFAYETAQGSQVTTFFEPKNSQALAIKMQDILEKKITEFHPIPITQIENPVVKTFADLINKLLA